MAATNPSTPAFANSKFEAARKAVLDMMETSKAGETDPDRIAKRKALRKATVELAEDPLNQRMLEENSTDPKINEHIRKLHLFLTDLLAPDNKGKMSNNDVEKHLSLLVDNARNALSGKDHDLELSGIDGSHGMLPHHQQKSVAVWSNMLAAILHRPGGTAPRRGDARTTSASINPDAVVLQSMNEMMQSFSEADLQAGAQIGVDVKDLVEELDKDKRNRRKTRSRKVVDEEDLADFSDLM